MRRYWMLKQEVDLVPLGFKILMVTGVSLPAYEGPPQELKLNRINPVPSLHVISVRCI
jgi:hypothetical protein